MAATTGERVASFFQWRDRYTPETRTAQLALARTARTRILALEGWLPGGLAALGLIGLAVVGRRWRSGPAAQRAA